MRLPEPGRRVTLRRLVGGTRADPQVGDVVGWLLSADADALVVERRDGEVVRVPRGAVLLCRVVPDRPGRSRRAQSMPAEELSRICSRGWPALERVALGAWELRAAGGFTGRANSAAVHGNPGMSLTEALDAVRTFYARRRLPARAQVVVGAEWEARIADAGWCSGSGGHATALVQVADLTEEPPVDPRVGHRAGLDDDWLAVYGRSGAEAAVRAVLTGPPRVRLLAIGSPAVAVGRAVATGEWLGIAAVAVQPSHRRAGLARAIVETALAWGYRQGCDKAYLQVEPDNEPALRLYEAYGFTTHHAYRYLEPGGV